MKKLSLKQRSNNKIFVNDGYQACFFQPLFNFRFLIFLTFFSIEHNYSLKFGLVIWLRKLVENRIEFAKSK